MAIPIRHQTKTLSRTAQLPLRFITATSLFDGHDAAINIIRRMLQDQGVEIVHLGHNRGVEEIVRAALQEDADGIAISSYQGGHLEFFRYLVDQLRTQGREDMLVFGGGGGTITPAEARELEIYGVEKIYLPQEGALQGLEGIIQDIMARTRRARQPPTFPKKIMLQESAAIGQALSLVEAGQWQSPIIVTGKAHIPVIGLTGTGGAGKSSLLDELLHYFLKSFPDLHLAVLALDPTRHRTGGALLGDRIRLNSLADPRIYLRSLATRSRHGVTSSSLPKLVSLLKSVGFDLILIETAGAGQADSEIVELVDLSVYVMTSDYGAPTQLEKIEMLDCADLVVLNKFDKSGSQDALRDIRQQWRRNHLAFSLPDEQVPVYATVASEFNNPGIAKLFSALCQKLAERYPEKAQKWQAALAPSVPSSGQKGIISFRRIHYLAEISEQGRHIRNGINKQVKAASQAQSHYKSLQALTDPHLPPPLAHYAQKILAENPEDSLSQLRQHYEEALEQLTEEALEHLRHWPETRRRLTNEYYTYSVRGQEIQGENYYKSLSHLRIPKVALPRCQDWGEILRFLLEENVPGEYPFTAGLYPYRRTTEELARMFAGEGTPERTNRRFHYLVRGQPSIRLSTAFDPIVLYGEDPAPQPDVFGRIGMSGVSVASLDDFKKLFSGFDLCQPNVSVSMTINGPAPMLLAWFFHTAIDQQVEKCLRRQGKWKAAQQRIKVFYRDQPRPRYGGDLPSGHDGLGLGLLGVSGEQLLPREHYEQIRADVLRHIRGTVQADILKEEQAQNECIFTTEFGLRLMGDIQEYFIAHQIRHYYSVSVSGYHIAEAGANPITQLAFTLANGFTLVEYYLSRGMAIDDFAPQMSFFFSNALDPEYAVIGRVARRIWARAMRERYGASPRSQMLKYHIQTSGRSLQAQEINFNDIRTTLEALYAIYDNCNSLHTNAYDEAVTTPTEESVRRALAIQLIINRELGLNYNQNVLQGSFLIQELTRLVEEAVYQELNRLSERGGVLGAMETNYQRNKIQEESLYYESRKHDGNLPIVGVNIFPSLRPEKTLLSGQLTRSSKEEKQAQVEAVELFKHRQAAQAEAALAQLQQVVRRGGNSFEALMRTVQHCTLGQITHALYGVGGQYRRRM
ncbi:Methylmalonyl-CoA mutase-like protein [Nitrosococcus oceani ATCC 19707]|uniref:Methylmalonyl-CoA mutase-like protein n=2 Tax=Nitrosococcus oceani TaxID=1229 RepID=Q3J9Y7_NITOC|nr:methylmalonyl-CoA mutase family protein [Nitrosococcus oceani]ABA58359.1 Methylmalonyl-CoA mutase-like protein [Nitrosococcus oceani ATCC 19707]KFI19162.1 methylmalonyl-CoA mutase [Nitrosococcus oceani C-27]GEM18746.1 methylmalonyl-CoA mutase [Nitrosococcus oceani]